ncbi:unnamed protein product [Fraxinus pennsylvanica]|uniref:RNase H type-1 domain-containing protein n=1 Tax=Fraxinus pennsylvanica TaxID=56036 RepID=A0AAD1ZG24_9LAMI|nr:unnamed protein product [Fraxinus pennsylvanica]
MWYSRNQFIFEHKIFTPRMTIDHVLTIAGEFKCAQKQKQQGTHSREGWSPPPKGVLKLNVDGALFEDQCRYETEMVIRDATCKMIFSASKPEKGSMDPTEAELLAMLRGLQIYLPLSIQNLQVIPLKLQTTKKKKKKKRIKIAPFIYLFLYSDLPQN